MAIIRKDEHFPSSEGHTEIVYTRWVDDALPPKALLVIAHGMAEYIGRYDEFARFMAEQGWAVYGEDHLGHGKTCPRPGDRGYFAEKDGRYCLVEDIRSLCNIAKKDFPALPLVLMGHSMGSFIVRLFCMHYSDEISAALFMGTAGPNPASKAGLALTNFVAKIKGEKKHSRLISTLVDGASSGGTNERTPFDWLNTIPEEVDKYIADPDCGFPFTLSGYRELLKMMIEMNAPGWTKNIRPGLPIMVISGEADPVGGMGKGVTEVYQTLKNTGLKATLNLFPGLRHEILLEHDKPQVWNTILHWCNTSI